MSTLTRSELREELKTFADDIVAHVRAEVSTCYGPEKRASRKVKEGGRKYNAPQLKSGRFFGPSNARDRVDGSVASLENGTSENKNYVGVGEPEDSSFHRWRGSTGFGDDAGRCEESVPLRAMSEASVSSRSRKFTSTVVNLDDYFQMGPRWRDDCSSAWRDNLESCVLHPRFQYLVGVVVLLNALFIGYQTSIHAELAGINDNKTDAVGLSFCVFFVCEYLLRVWVQRCDFFLGDGAWLNLFDSCAVVTQVCEEAIKLFHLFVGGTKTTERAVQMFQIIRIGRVLRVMYLFDELRQILASVGSSISVLWWSLVLLVLVIYTFSVMFFQFASNAGETPHESHIRYYFGSLTRTMFTMFEATTGGLSWDEAASPLVSDISPALGVLFVLYIAVSLLAIMNLLTGVFMDKAMSCVREDQDTRLAAQIRDIFFESHRDLTEISQEMFHETMQDAAMHEYLRQINVNTDEAAGLFSLLDADGSSTINANEIIDGLLRLRGPAKAFELALLMREVGVIRQMVDDVFLRVDDVLDQMRVLSPPEKKSQDLGVPTPYSSEAVSPWKI